MNCILMKARNVFVLSAVTTALAVGAIACSGGAGDPNGGTASTQPSAGADVASATVRYDGETAFRGVYLGTGPVAQKLPELRDPGLAAEAQKLTKEQLATHLQGAAERMRVETKTQAAAQDVDHLAGKLRTGEVTPEQLLEARRDFTATFGDQIVSRIRAVDASFFARFGADLQSGDRLLIQRTLEDGAKLFLDAASVEGALSGRVSQERRCVAILVAVVWVAVLASEYFWTPQPGVAGAQSDLRQAELVDAIATRLAAP